jgi:hypothetical protein
VKRALLAMALSSGPAMAWDEDRFLQALALVETANDDRAVGSAGERSRYQIGAMVWRQWEPGLPHSWCRGQMARSVAERHVRWLRRELGPGLRDDPAAVASAWNRGLAGYRKKGANDHGRRVAAVYRHVRSGQARRATGQNGEIRGRCISGYRVGDSDSQIFDFLNNSDEQ